MKTKTNTTRNANRAKVLFVAGMIMIQVSLIAGENADLKLDSDNTVNAYSECTKSPIAYNAINTCFYLNEVASESEYEIEDWMCNIHNNDLNTQWDEEELELEEWMYKTEHIFWMDLNDVEESELAIECWMANPNSWLNTKDELMLTAK